MHIRTWCCTAASAGATKPAAEFPALRLPFTNWVEVVALGLFTEPAGVEGLLVPGMVPVAEG
jgi:hypothetical protein